MPKSDKETFKRRVRDVAGLLVMGVDFNGIWKFATAKGWSVGDRQVRHYIKKARAELAKNTEQDYKELRSRIVAQFRMLFARAVKDNDLRSAKQALREEALLHGLYASKSGLVPGSGVRAGASDRSVSLKRMERVSCLLAAQVRDDPGEVQLLEDAMPRRYYCVSDTMLPLWFLHILSMVYVMEQLEQVATLLYALHCAAAEEAVEGSWQLSVLISSYRFSIGSDGWNQFAQSLGVDGDYLVSRNYQGDMLKMCQEAIHKLAPPADALAAALTKAGLTAAPLLSANDLAKNWRRLVAKFVSD